MFRRISSFFKRIFEGLILFTSLIYLFEALRVPIKTHELKFKKPLEDIVKLLETEQGANPYTHLVRLAKQPKGSWEWGSYEGNKAKDFYNEHIKPLLVAGDLEKAKKLIDILYNYDRFSPGQDVQVLKYTIKKDRETLTSNFKILFFSVDWYWGQVKKVPDGYLRLLTLVSGCFKFNDCYLEDGLAPPMPHGRLDLEYCTVLKDVTNAKNMVTWEIVDTGKTVDPIWEKVNREFRE